MRGGGGGPAVVGDAVRREIRRPRFVAEGVIMFQEGDLVGQTKLGIKYFRVIL